MGARTSPDLNLRAGCGPRLPISWGTLIFSRPKWTGECMVKKARALRPSARIASLNRRLAGVDHRETELVAFRLRDAVSEVALDRNAALLRVERTHLTEELERQRETMSTLEQGQAAVASLKALREHMCDRLDFRDPGRTAALSWIPWRPA